MKYMGSKARIAKEISAIINGVIGYTNTNLYIEPFVGGANMIQHIKCPHKIGIDNNVFLISFWNRLKGGWNPLDDINMTKELYENIKNNKLSYPQSVVALAGFCATYNAKWFGGYAGVVKTKNNTYRNYYEEAVRNVLRQVPQIKDVDFMYGDYKQIDPNLTGAVIYCDPPYKGTTGYKDPFDHTSYWNWVRMMSAENIVLCSEYNAPSDFLCVWQKQITTTLDKSSRMDAIEKLFVYRGIERIVTPVPQE